MEDNEADRFIMGGFGLFFISSLLLVVSIKRGEALGHTSLNVLIMWLSVAVNVTGGFLTRAGLRGNYSISREWIQTIGIFGTLIGVGTGTRAVLSCGPYLSSNPISLLETAPLIAVFFVGCFLLGLASLNALFKS